MTGKIEITYEWWARDPVTGEKSSVLEQHEKELRDEAEDDIPRMMRDGFGSGVLACSVGVGDDVVTYEGWWEYVRVTEEAPCGS